LISIGIIHEYVTYVEVSVHHKFLSSHNITLQCSIQTSKDELNNENFVMKYGESKCEFE